ncbi:AcrR family transcriptional regulator [Streptomyces griseochromogenes]|uniref:AcrR family transcriptional regulator n=1 Tax=Streptomyces griseochromogenes TaxID=68214 RepID=A0A1B1BB31_9ACTN|nr:TetR/AcrR family transcriptional regulator [Streptomyces griseochromogenes]ANP56044.1 TetR family transcriptional regulator [Streptomyces griseochromogenes]MBP2051104.1 AcrR family transcriptional regulator [Streptomyces griseochromogenes]
MAEELGLRERKKRDTKWRIYRTALDLFVESGFDKVSVQEIADASDVSKMTVFNYFGSKEDLVFHPMEEHFGDAARAVRDRGPGESAVDAVRRQFLEMIEVRDPSVGLHSEPFVLLVRRVVEETPVLRERVVVAAQRGIRAMTDLLAEESGDPVLATVAATTLSAARNALIEDHHRRLAAGESPEAIAAGAVERAHRAFDLVENGLKGYAVKA